MSQYGWRLQENDHMQDTFEMLEELLEQEQFELLFPTEEIERDGYSRGESASGNEEEQAKKKNSERAVRKPSSSEIRLVYLMNDAVESFLIFRKARLTGSYISDYEGFLKSSLNREGDEYILVVWQGENVVTLFFQDLDLEVHLYNYGEIGHFWVPEYEYLRQLEYRIAIARDKLEYLGQEFCTEEEQSLVQLADFPPLNYCCYPAVPRQYIVPKEDPWIPSAQAFQVMEKLIKEVQDSSLLRLLHLYEKFPSPLVARIFARALHKTRHAAVVDLLTSKIKKEQIKMAFLTLNHKSEAIGKAMQLSLIAPDSFSEKPLRVLYLLHGLSDDCTAWGRYTSVERYLKFNNDTLVVMPDAHKSFYADMVFGDKFYTYITEELPAYIKSLFNVSGKREDTYIAGLSMGGYGAFKIALSRPDNYAAAASFSGVLAIAEHMTADSDWPDLAKIIMGDQNAKESDANLFNLLKKDMKNKPRLLQMCGTEDFLYADNALFKSVIEKTDFDYEYKEAPGAHNWDFWDGCIQYALKFFGIEG